MSNMSAQIAQAQQPRSIAGYIEQLKPEIARALPKGLDPDRVARLALTVVRQSEMAKRKGVAKTSLADCTPESFAGALLTAVALGLEPGVDGEAYLIPYGKEATFVPGFKGLSKLFFQHPLARHLDAQTVYENDEFDFAYGLDPHLSHRPARGDRGKPIYFYAVASLSTGASRFEVMTPEEVSAVRKASAKRSGDIRDPQMWMQRKTVLKQLLKLMPKSTQMTQALAADERSGSELQAEHVPAEISRGEAPAIEQGIDLVTGEVVDPGPAYEEAFPVDDARDDGPPDVPSSGGSVAGRPAASGEPVAQPSRSGDGVAAGEGGDAVPDRPKLTTKQRSALMTRWTKLGIQRGDRDERLLITCTLLGLEPGSLKSTSDLSAEDASRLLDLLNEVTDRDDLDRRLSGQEPMAGDAQ